MSIQYSILIPTYKSSSLEVLLDELKQFFSGSYTYEIIVINDGGVSLSLPENITLLNFDKNRGKNYALFEGLKVANGTYVLTLDDDGQHPVSEISKLIALQNHDVVVGQYQSENGPESKIKHWTEVLLFGKTNKIKFTPFKLFKRSILKLDTFYNRVPFMSVLLLESSKDIVGVDVIVDVVRNVNSRFSLRKKLIFYRNLIASKNEFFRLLMQVKLKR